MNRPQQIEIMNGIREINSNLISYYGYTSLNRHLTELENALSIIAEHKMAELDLTNIPTGNSNYSFSQADRELTSIAIIAGRIPRNEMPDAILNKIDEVSCLLFNEFLDLDPDSEASEDPEDPGYDTEGDYDRRVYVQEVKEDGYNTEGDYDP